MLKPDMGGYIGGMITLEGSFKVNGATTPDDVRSGNTNAFTVARTSAGLFTVTFADFLPYLPQKCVTEKAWCNTADVTPIVETECSVVEGSYSQVTRSFQILATVGVTATDPDDNSRVCFELRGSFLPVNTD